MDTKVSDTIDNSILKSDDPSNEYIVNRRRRRYSESFKQRILEEAGRCVEHGSLGAFLRREGIYASTLNDFRKQKARTSLVTKDGRPRKKGDINSSDVQTLKDLAVAEREIRRLNRELFQARALLEIQKKVSEIMGLSLDALD